MKYVLIISGVLLLAGLGYWYYSRHYGLEDIGPPPPPPPDPVPRTSRSQTTKGLDPGQVCNAVLNAGTKAVTGQSNFVTRAGTKLECGIWNLEANVAKKVVSVIATPFKALFG